MPQLEKKSAPNGADLVFGQLRRAGHCADARVQTCLKGIGVETCGLSLSRFARSRELATVAGLQLLHDLANVP